MEGNNNIFIFDNFGDSSVLRNGYNHSTQINEFIFHKCVCAQSASNIMGTDYKFGDDDDNDSEGQTNASRLSPTKKSS